MAKRSHLKIFLSCSAADRAEAAGLFERLETANFQPAWSIEGILETGSPWVQVTADALSGSDIILPCLSASFLSSKVLTDELQRALAQQKAIMPIFLERAAVDLVTRKLGPLSDHYGIALYDASGFQELVVALRRLADSVAPLRRRSGIFLRKLTLVDIKGFERFELELSADRKPASATVILGDNAAGKSSLLRSIALGLCGEGDGSALLQQLPGTFIRDGATEGFIHLELLDLETGRDIATVTRIQKSATTEIVRKETEPESFPWDGLFVCAYGTNRSRLATASYEAYSLYQALRPLFDDAASLQNPEVVLLRQEPRRRAELEQRLLRVLMLDGPQHVFAYPRSGPQIHGPWGNQPISNLSDGYRSTAQWVLDFFGWSTYADRLTDTGEVGGILIIDEIEQHLHPLWQRHMLQRLHQQLPTTQIFVSTHTPLIVSGAVDVEGARIVRLKMHEDGSVEKVEIDPKSLDNLRADQVLATEAFGLLTSRNPGSETEIDRYAELLGKENRTPAEEELLQQMAATLKTSLALGETQLEREIGLAVDTVLKDRLATVDPDQLDIEVKRQLRSIFRSGEES